MSRHHSGAMVERHEVMMSIDRIWWTLRVLTSKNIQKNCLKRVVEGQLVEVFCFGVLGNICGSCFALLKNNQ